MCFNPKDIRWQTMRASGPGGQHVNKTESAVRVIHLPTGTEATAMEECSQHRNRKLALARLMQKLKQLDATRFGQARHERWRAHIRNCNVGIPYASFVQSNQMVV